MVCLSMIDRERKIQKAKSACLSNKKRTLVRFLLDKFSISIPDLASANHSFGRPFADETPYCANIAHK